MRRLLIVPLTAVLLFTAAGAAEAKVSRARIVSVPTGICMIHGDGGIGCFGDAVPAKYTDGYLHLRKRGQVKLGDAGGPLAPVSERPVRLRPGDRWSKRRIRCRVIRGGIKCQNRARHGFWLKKRGYRDW